VENRIAKGNENFCKIDENIYEKGIKIKDEEMDKLNLQRDDFHGEWNYSLHLQ
jgi:hypothetical protein